MIGKKSRIILVSALSLLLLPAFGGIALTAQDKKQDPPDDAALREAEKTVRNVFKDDYAKRGPADRQALARLLLQQAIDTKDDAAARFVLFRESQDIAARLGDIETSFRAIEEMSRAFSVNPIALKNTALTLAGGVPRTPEEHKTYAQAYLSLADDAAKARQFDVAAKAAQGATAAAKKAKDVALLSKAEAQVKSAGVIQEKAEKAKKAVESLAATPDLPDANQVVGEFECFVLGDWDAGLPKLAKGTDPALKTLAAKDLSRPTDGPAQAGLGDDWWDRAERESGVLKSNLRDRAGFWYEKAGGQLSGMSRLKVDKRLAELGIFKGGPPGGPGSIDVTTLKVKKPSVAAGSLGINTSDAEEKLLVSGRECTRFIFAHANSSLTFDIPAGARFFQATGVKLRARVEGSWKYLVVLDGRTAYESKPLNEYPGCEVEISVSIPPGAKEIQLRVDDCGNNNGDHSVWAYPRFQK